MAKLVYIGGYGRSGSTLLEYLLTTAPRSSPAAKSSGIFADLANEQDLHLWPSLEEVPGVGSLSAQIGKAEGMESRAADLGAARACFRRLRGDGRFVQDRLGLLRSCRSVCREISVMISCWSISCETHAALPGPLCGRRFMPEPHEKAGLRLAG